MKRREFMAGSGALAVGALAESGPTIAGTADGFYLSAANPIANRDQQMLEREALAILARPDVQKAKLAALSAFQLVTSNSVDAEAKRILPSFVDSYAFRAIQLAVNSDPNYPRAFRVYSPAARWLGNDVPQSRWGKENPDNCYRLIPVAKGGRYVIRGKQQPNPPSSVSYTLVADTNTSVTVQLIEQSAIALRPDGSFEITLDDTPPGDRKNHFQLTNEALYVFIRDTMADWAQTPNALRVERLNAPTRGPFTLDEIAARARWIIETGVAASYYWHRSTINVPVQTLRPPVLSGPLGGLLSQLGTSGWFRIADDEAAIITIDSLDAAYTSVTLYDIWGRTLEYRDHLTCFNTAAMTADAGGGFTFVLAHRDPSVPNWLDTTGLHELGVGVRWQGLRGKIEIPPSIATQVVKLADLPQNLPSGVRSFSEQDRARQIALRQKVYDRRFIDS